MREAGMGAALIYVVGASGSGKDSLMRYARERLCTVPGICFAHRYITRPAGAGGENHVALTEEEFTARCQARLFALHWESHGLRYGIGIELNQWLSKGVTVVVNGSREYLHEAWKRYPEMLPVHIEVGHDVLRERLLSRGRETPAQVEKRLERNQGLQSSGFHGTVIPNNETLDVAGEALVDLIRKCSGAFECA
jgi:ribose 1,5-bisphosphokinase